MRAETQTAPALHWNQQKNPELHRESLTFTSTPSLRLVNLLAYTPALDSPWNERLVSECLATIPVGVPAWQLANQSKADV